MKTRKVLSLLLALILMVSLAACGKKQSAEQTNSSSNGEISGKLVVWSWDVAAKSLQETAEKFKQKYPNVDIQVEDLGDSQVYDKLTTGLAANVGLPDVVTIEGERVATFVSKFPKGFVDLTNDINKSDFLPVKISECTVNGKVVAYPWDGAPAGLYYRKDLFEKAGIKAEDIKTWDDFIEAGKKMDKTGVKMVPIAISKNEMLYREILAEMNSFYFDKDGKTILNSEESIKAMELVKKMVDANIYFDNTNWDGLVTATKSGKIATVPSAVWWSGTLQDECPEASGKWAVMRLPAVEAGGKTAAVNGGSNLMVPAATQNQRAAVEFVKFAMTDKDSLINGFSKYGLYPSYIPVYSDPIFDKGVEYFGGQKVWKLFAEIGKEVPEVNYTENLAETMTMIQDAQARIMLKGANVKDTMEQLQKDVVNKFGQ